MTSLFDQHAKKLQRDEAPLAARMRPQNLDEYVGQQHIVGPGRLLRRAIEADQLSSLIFYGPPGTGKTTLARVIANHTKAQFLSLNAVLSGVKDIRAAIATAKDHRGQFGQRTILFVDEVHRFNKAQQDALLPWVENGTVILIGATTENPYFEVNKALVSRSRIFQLKPLNDDDLRQIAANALANHKRGYGALDVRIDPDALDHLVNVANGDARALLNAVELAVETTPESDTVVRIDLAVAEESIQRRAVLYDKEGDAHFDVISAFIKSVRGSDPDAALYWLAKMVYAGEDPRFILRRLLILASEDIGLADPNALVVVNACADAFDRVGMPEGRYHLAQATLYMATTEKSNSTMAFFDALSTVENEGDGEVPNHLRDGNRDKEGFGHGKGYLYPHAYRDHWVEQQYLPSSLQGRTFYDPSDQGYEADIQVRVQRRRDAQLAAMVDGLAVEPVENLTWSPRDRDVDRWLQRTAGDAGEHLGTIRDAVFSGARLQRHGTILDLNAGSGLLTFEAVRRAPEGGVWAWTTNARDAEAIEQRASALPELRRPHVLASPLDDAINGWIERELTFDAIVGRNALVKHPDKRHALQALLSVVANDGILSLAESVPRHTPRLYSLLDPDEIDAELQERWQAAEEALYDNPDDPMVNWSEEDLVSWARQVGWENVRLEVLTVSHRLHVTGAMLDRWFDETNPQSWAERVAPELRANDLTGIRELFERNLRDETAEWHLTVALLMGTQVS